ncbi:LOW QUALITY PROTEIN: T-cell surface glycoprotein CD8 alpha chain-like [Corapipo altera]|uniref:LOW QUALITY PROTEIN: T-cell surface glycoprotein CD8 alpha chain-like n=1 Tax=Corapipo altera TaxID=415028 RepID=UPI000FD6252D|nr:LOW QUALITY PROTEIN: T-cell surface glycoprotein CD8 alpha chain-like [Corapipo altera]
MPSTVSLPKRVLMTSHPPQSEMQPPKSRENDHLSSTAPSPRTDPQQKMDGSPVLLLLLALGLCCPGIHGQMYEMKIRFRNSITQLQVGQRLELECRTDKKDSGMFWVHQDKSGTLHFIVFISSISKITFTGNQRTSTRFEASKDNTIYWLVVKSFTQQDEGNYFCLMNINQMLYFSPGQPAFFPVTTTVAPTTTRPTTQHDITEKDPFVETSDPETSTENELNFFCDLLIWVPLAGTCLLLLIALAITITLCQRTRRRRCRCKRLDLYCFI